MTAEAKSSGVNAKQLVATAAGLSTLLALSTDSSLVGRVVPPPELDLERVRSCIIVVENLPAAASVDMMTQLFSAIGEVNMARICQPEAGNSSSSYVSQVAVATIHMIREL